MMSLQRYLDLAQNWIGELEPREWAMFAAMMLVVGLICLRGLVAQRPY